MSLMPDLRSLSVDMNNLSSLGTLLSPPTTTTGTSQLRYLSAKHNAIAQVDDVTAGHGFARLCDLSLYRNALAGAIPSSAFAGLHLLQRLDLGRNRIEDVPVRAAAVCCGRVLCGDERTPLVCYRRGVC